MPTSAALDRVAEAKGKECFETPTGENKIGIILRNSLVQNGLSCLYSYNYLA